MEDPVKEIPGIISAIVQNDDLKLQEETVFRYFAESAVLDHMVVYSKGAQEILATYQIWAMSNYSLRTTTQQVIYHEEDDTLMVRMTQYVRKWWYPFQEVVMPMMVYFKLEDVPDSGEERVGGKGKRKRIIYQQDYHCLDPILLNVPVTGTIAYGKFGLRTIVTNLSYFTIKALKATIGTEGITHAAKAAYQFIGLKQQDTHRSR